MPIAVIGGFLVACITATVFTQVAPVRDVIAWLTAVALLSTYRLVAWWKFRRADFIVAVAQRWLRTALWGALLSGILWGAGSFILTAAAQIDYLLLYVWAVVMMSVAAMFSFSAYYPCFIAFLLAWGIPVIAHVASRNTLMHWSVAAGMLMYGLVAARFMWTFSHVFIESLQLSFDNRDLARKLLEQKNAAEAANLAKSRFLAVASHDLRQPMHALILYAGTLASLELPERARELLTKLRQCGDAMDKMFRALLDISRLDAGAVQPELQYFAIESLLNRLRMEFEPQACNRELELRVAPCSAVVHSDPALVERILRNFVANAVAHTNRGKVLIGCRRRPGKLRVAVYDTGPGIAPGQQSAVFQEFFQISNPERDRSKGLGLGLAIVDRLAKLLATPIILVSQPGKGSLFAIELSLGSLPHGEAKLPATASTGARHDLRGLLIVAVDDEATVLDATRALLESWGCTVVTAASGAEALVNLATSTRTPDLLMCDYRLRGQEDGLQVIEALRTEFNADIPAVLITGDTGPDKLREIGASGLLVLHKPIREEQLRASLSSLVATD